jgi:glycosyltransferase involved in cell wall biosynthesis
MRVAHCIHGLDLGGAQQVVRLLVQRGGPGFQQWVYSPCGGVFAEQVAGAGATVRILPRRLPKFDPGWVFRLAAAMREDAIDLVHTHLFGDSLHGYLAARLAGGKPVVMTLHNIARARTRLQRLGYRWLLGRASAVVACSAAVRQSFLDEVGGAGDRIRTIPNGIDEPTVPLDRGAARQRLGLEPDDLVIAAIGRLVPAKGLDVLMDAVGEVVGREGILPRLVIVGDGPLRARLEAHAAGAGIKELVSFLGFRPDVQQIMAAFDVVGFGSRDEGLPMVLLEAMAAARCIVATDVGGMAEAIRNEREGLIVSSATPAALARALTQALVSSELRQRLGAAAARRFRDLFTAQRMVASYQDLYRQVDARRRTVPHALDNASAAAL